MSAYQYGIGNLGVVNSLRETVADSVVLQRHIAQQSAERVGRSFDQLSRLSRVRDKQCNKRNTYQQCGDFGNVLRESITHEFTYIVVITLVSELPRTASFVLVNCFDGDMLAID